MEGHDRRRPQPRGARLPPGARQVVRAKAGVSTAAERPSPSAPYFGHLTRAQHDNASELPGRPQAWIEGADALAWRDRDGGRSGYERREAQDVVGCPWTTS